MIKIICDRCKREISGKPRYIEFGVKDGKEDEIEKTSGESDYCKKCIAEIKEFITREPTPALDPLIADSTESTPAAAGQTVNEKSGERNKPIDMGKVNALREAEWSIGKIAEEMHIPTEDLAEKIFDHKVQEHESRKVNVRRDAEWYRNRKRDKSKT